MQPFLKKAASHIASMTMVGEDIPHPENRITLSNNKDANGIPVAHAAHDRSDQIIAVWDQASVLVQIGLLDAKNLPVAGIETARKVVDNTQRINELMANWASSEGKPL